jgi:hypothetical protein
MAGLPTPAADGVDVRGPIDPGRLRRIQGTLYFARQQAVIVGQHALLARDGETPRLYDRALDPHWTDDVAADHPDLAAHLTSLLGDATSGPTTAADVDHEALRALGYVE